MKIAVLSILLALVCHFEARPQNEAANWYFGNKAGLNFPRGNPTPIVLTDGMLNTNEGCAAVSDSNGNLLFYTDGIYVWNKYHELVNNGSGLFGHRSSTQSALILPKPGSKGIYYIFTIDATESASNSLGCRYSLIDADYNGGRGNVVTKNSYLFGPCIEKLTAVRHSNGRDFWTLVHETGTNKLNAYLVHQNGINTLPIVSSMGSIIRSEEGVIGYIKASHDGTKIAMATYNKDIVELCDFNTSTGKAANPITIAHSLLRKPYGVEFSPSGRYLYISTAETPGRIFQYDISQHDQSAIINSRKIIHVNDLEYFGALQLAPNGQIYAAKVNSEYLASIAFPEDEGHYCGYSDNAVFLNNRISMHGLPNIYSGVFDYRIELSYNSPLCEGEPLKLRAYIPPYIQLQDFEWQGPGGFTSLDHNPEIPNANPTMSGVYYFRVEINNMTLVYRLNVEVLKKPKISIIPTEISICTGDSATIQLVNLENDELSLLWSTGDTTSSIIVRHSGNYSVTAINGKGCSETVNCIVNVNPLPDFSILPGDSIKLCPGSAIELSCSGAFQEYLWSTGATTPAITVTNGGDYSLTVTDDNGCNNTKKIKVMALPDFDVRIIGSSLLCKGSETELSSSRAFPSYLWSTGDTTKTIRVSSEGNYTLTVTDSNGCSKTTSHSIELIDISLTGLEDINFGRVPAGEPTTLTFTITNSGNSPALINSISLKNNSAWGEVFAFPPAPLGLEKGNSMTLSLVINTTEVNNYKDSVIIEITSPCYLRLALPSFGSVYGSTLVWMPDTITVPGLNDFCIPIRTRKLNNFSINTPLSFTAEIKFQVNSFYPSGPTRGVVVNDYRFITISRNDVLLDDNPTRIAEICGLTMIPDSERVELTINSFVWHHPLIERTRKNGSLTIYLCQESLGRIKTIQPTQFTITPNPAESNIHVYIFSEEIGKFGFYIYNIQGSLVAIHEWESVGKHEKTIEALPANSSVGVYRAVLRTPMKTITKPVLIIK